MIAALRSAVKNDFSRRPLSHYAPEVIFKDDNMAKTITKFRSAKPIRLQPSVPAKKAAVLIPLCIVNEKVSLLYTLRASNLKSHRGQVSFPGGMQDMTDKNLERTALRETKEELGIAEDGIQVWGSGNMIITRGDTCVLPVVGHFKEKLDLNKLNVNAQEVEEVFVVSLEDLCNEKKIGHTQFRGAYSTPVYFGGRRKIWGLTAAITNIFLKSLLPQRAYTHRIKYIVPAKAQYFQ